VIKVGLSAFRSEVRLFQRTNSGVQLIHINIFRHCCASTADHQEFNQPKGDAVVVWLMPPGLKMLGSRQRMNRIFLTLLNLQRLGTRLPSEQRKGSEEEE